MNKKRSEERASHLLAVRDLETEYLNKRIDILEEAARKYRESMASAAVTLTACLNGSTAYIAAQSTAVYAVYSARLAKLEKPRAKTVARRKGRFSRDAARARMAEK